MEFKVPRTWTDLADGDTHVLFEDHIADQLRALWMGQAAGDMDYYTSAVAKARLAIGQKGLPLTAGTSFAEWLGIPVWFAYPLIGELYAANPTNVTDIMGNIIPVWPNWTNPLYFYDQGTRGIYDDVKHDPYGLSAIGYAGYTDKITIPTGMGGTWAIFTWVYNGSETTSQFSKIELKLEKNGSEISGVNNYMYQVSDVISGTGYKKGRLNNFYVGKFAAGDYIKWRVYMAGTMMGTSEGVYAAAFALKIG